MKSNIITYLFNLIISNILLLSFTQDQVVSQNTIKSFKNHISITELLSESILIMSPEQKPLFTGEKLISLDSIAYLAVKHGKNRWKGALKGAMIGAIVGTITGTITGISMCHSEPKSSIGYMWRNITVGQGIVCANLVVIPISSIIGLCIGAKKKNKFELNGKTYKYKEK